MKYLLMMLMTANIFANDVKVLCYDRFEDETIDLVTRRHSSCMSSFLWGKDNVCFEGNASDLVDLINDNFFEYRSAGYIVSEAEETREGVSYLGIDQQSFWQTESSIKPCK